MDSENSEQYAFPDYLKKSLEGGNSRATIEHQWHREKEAPDKHIYNPDESMIDFQGLGFDEWQGMQNES